MKVIKNMSKFNLKWSIKWLFRLLSGIGISVVSYLLLSLFFDTPIEYEIKLSNHKLEEQYNILNNRFDSVNNVLQNIVERDKNIHKILFESEPYTASLDSVNKFEAQNRLNEMNNMELGDELLERTSMLYQRAYNVNAKIDQMQQYIEANRELVSTIPAIQPIENADFSLLTASYGNRIHPFYKTMKMHRGIDFSIPVGTAVFATADGTVEQIAMRGQNSGTTIMLKHSNLYKTFYAHLDNVLVSVGQKIKRGDVIAFSGNTGLSFAPHLHYEVRLRGKQVDPIDYFFLETNINNIDRLHSIAATGMQAFD